MPHRNISPLAKDEVISKEMDNGSEKLPLSVSFFYPNKHRRMEMFFENRYDAGERIAQIVKQQINNQWDIVGIARGGVIIAGEIAKALGTKAKAICVEDLFMKKGVLVSSSLGSGVAFDGVFFGESGKFIVDVSNCGIPGAQKLFQKTKKKQIGFAGTATNYGTKVLICDDGVISGRTLLTAVQSLRHYGVSQVAVAIPVILPWVAAQSDFPVFTWRVTKMTSPATGMFYKEFDDTMDEEVIRILGN